MANGAVETLIPISELGAASLPPGLRRSAREASEVDFRNEVSYAELPCKSLISSCDSERVPFRWTINPYRGCEFGCAYCYARYTHEFIELRRWEEFERKIFVKRGAAAALAEDLRRNRREGEWIAIGTATDPYQPAERRFGVTRSVLEVFARFEGLRLSITTKSNLILRDLPLLCEISRRSQVHLNLTVTTLRRDLARVLEPRAPRPDVRLSAVEKLAGAGLPVNVFMMPVMPRVNDSLTEADALMAAAAAAGARSLVWQVLFLRACSRRRFFPWVAEHFPTLLPTYRRLYGPSPEPLAAYTRELAPAFRQLVEKHGLSWRRSAESDSQPRGSQTTLDL